MPAATASRITTLAAICGILNIIIEAGAARVVRADGSHLGFVPVNTIGRIYAVPAAFAPAGTEGTLYYIPFTGPGGPTRAIVDHLSAIIISCEFHLDMEYPA